MDKMKASEVMKQMIANSQVAMIQEDKNLIGATSDIIGNMNNAPDWKSIIQVINANNEFVRMITVKSIVKTLIDCGLVESDFNIDVVEVTNDILNNAVSEVCKEYK